jgi:ankyrin repeat protein
MDAIGLKLKRACAQGDLAQVRALVEAGADVNATDEYGSGTLLTFHPAVMEYLLSKGADPNRQTNECGDAVLLGIACYNHLDCVRLLLAAGADAKVLIKNTGENALHCVVVGLGEHATPADRHAIVKLLIAHGVNPNQRTIPGVATGIFWRDVRTRGETPLHRAAAYASDETVKFLLDAGADKRIRDANGDSPQSWASWHWRPKPLIDLLDPQD